MILHQQEVVKPSLHFLPVRLHLLPCVAAHIPFDGGILVIDLDGHHRRIFDQRQPCIRIHMTEKLSGIFLLQLDHPLIIHTVPLDAGRCAAGIIHPVPFQKFSRHDQVNMEIDPLLLQLRREIVKPVQSLRIELPARAGFIIEKRRLLTAAPASRFFSYRGVRRVKTDDVDAHTGEPLRHFVRRLMIRGVGTCGYVKSQKSCPGAVLEIEMSVFCAHKPMFSRRSVQQMGIIQNPCIRFRLVYPDMLFHSGFPPFRLLCLLCHCFR